MSLNLAAVDGRVVLVLFTGADAPSALKGAARWNGRDLAVALPAGDEFVIPPDAMHTLQPLAPEVANLFDPGEPAHALLHDAAYVVGVRSVAPPAAAQPTDAIVTGVLAPVRS